MAVRLTAPPRRLGGLANPLRAHNCFLNVALQVFWHSPSFQRALLEWREYVVFDGFDLPTLLCDTFAQMAQKEVTDSEMLRTALETINPDLFLAGEEGDPMEAMAFILRLLYESSPRVYEERRHRSMAARRALASDADVKKLLKMYHDPWPVAESGALPVQVYELRGREWTRSGREPRGDALPFRSFSLSLDMRTFLGFQKGRHDRDTPWSRPTMKLNEFEARIAFAAACDLSDAERRVVMRDVFEVPESDAGTDRSEPSEGAERWTERVLESVPMMFLLDFLLPAAPRASSVDIMFRHLLSGLPLRPHMVFSNSTIPPGGHTTWPEYVLSGVVLFGGGHYVVAFFDRVENGWLLYDDDKVEFFFSTAEFFRVCLARLLIPTIAVFQESTSIVRQSMDVTRMRFLRGIEVRAPRTLPHPEPPWNTVSHEDILRRREELRLRALREDEESARVAAELATGSASWASRRSSSVPRRGREDAPRPLYAIDAPLRTTLPADPSLAGTPALRPLEFNDDGLFTVPADWGDKEVTALEPRAGVKPLEEEEEEEGKEEGKEEGWCQQLRRC